MLLTVDELNTFDIISMDKLLISEEALKLLEEVLE
jgi:ribosomal protein L4